MTARHPKVSICVPNLNTQPYLPERFETIFSQTFEDWELIVYDSYSDDGSWEYIQELAAREPRMRISQTPRKGIYAGFNDCIRQGRGEYVYIATSDDSMVPACLERMVAALEEHPECGLCQCGLEIIDEKSRPHASLHWQDFAFGRFAPEWLKKRHIRRAPLDGLLHCALQTIYTSVTQLLIRRRVFDRVGLFESRWGAMGDFEWGMRVGLLEDCVFLPDILATWRAHFQQATGATESVASRRGMLAMSKVAFARARQVSAQALSHLNEKSFLQFYKQQIVNFGLRESRSRRSKIQFLAGETCHGNLSALTHIWNRFCGRSFEESAQFRALRLLLNRHGVAPPIFLE
jgi:glycosyltransferase involved in cell wall biosynthesis